MKHDIQVLREMLSEIERANADAEWMKSQPKTQAAADILRDRINLLTDAARYYAAPAVERMQLAYAPVTAGILLDPKTQMPIWNCAIAETIALTCPHCHSSVDCEVQIDRDGPIYAEIETEFCEDCHKHLCPKCPRSKGEGEEEGLIWCLDCRPAPPANPQSRWIYDTPDGKPMTVQIQAAGPFRIFGADDPQLIKPGMVSDGTLSAIRDATVTDGSKETK